MQLIAQDFLASATRSHRPDSHADVNCATLVASFRHTGAEPCVTLVAVAEGFGPGWTGDEACQLALQALRNQFVQAGEGDPVEILEQGIVAANQAVFDRAQGYEAVGEIGVEMVTGVVVAQQVTVQQIGRGAAFCVKHGEARALALDLETDGRFFLGQQRVLLHDQLATRPGSGVALQAGDLIVLTNGKLGELVTARQVASALAHAELARGVDRLIHLGKSQAPGERLTALIFGAPAGETGQTLFRPVLGWAAIVVLALAVLCWLLFSLLGGETAGSPVIPTSSILPVTQAMTVKPEPATTQLLLLPTIIPSPTPKPTGTSTLTPSPTASPTEPTPTDTPTLTATPTATATATARLTPSPTIPAAPIGMDGQVVVVGTEGLGISLRAGPDIGFERLAVIADGERLTVIGGPEGEAGAVWWQLRALDGLEGWGNARFLQGVAPD